MGQSPRSCACGPKGRPPTRAICPFSPVVGDSGRHPNLPSLPWASWRTSPDLVHSLSVPPPCRRAHRAVLGFLCRQFGLCHHQEKERLRPRLPGTVPFHNALNVRGGRYGFAYTRSFLMPLIRRAAWTSLLLATSHAGVDGIRAVENRARCPLLVFMVNVSRFTETVAFRKTPSIIRLTASGDNFHIK